MAAAAALLASAVAAGASTAGRQGPRSIPSADAGTGSVSSHGRVHVKFAEGTGIRLRGDRFAGGRNGGDDAAGLETVLRKFAGVRIQRLFTQPEVELSRDQGRIEATSRRRLADLNLYYRLTVPDARDAAELVDALNPLGIVEIAYAEPPLPPPPVTASFVNLQFYGSAAPIGIDSGSTATFPGGTGDRVSVIDIEYSWDQSHEDLANARVAGALIPNGTPSDPFQSTDHGTAVLGELSADGNTFGVTGLVPGAGLGMVNAFNTERGYDLANSINIARQHLNPGDVIVIEQQAQGPGPTGAYVPSEWVPVVYDAVVTATAAGVIVVAAAGNGGENLDNADRYGSPFPGGRPDSGAIIVGAGAAVSVDGKCGGFTPSRSRLSFSTYGSRVNLQGWGECVVTTGYGDLTSGVPLNTRYTRFFNGTSSATPIVAAAAAAVSSVIEHRSGHPATPAQVRAILTATGTAQEFASPGALPGKIGPLPNLAAALASLDTSPPAIAIAAPPSGASYRLGEVVFADYGCSDESGGSGLASCLGSVPDGAPIDTSSLGQHTFTVTAKDNATNQTTVTNTYFVHETVPPAIAIAAPQNGASYRLGEIVFADYGCSDESGGSGLASCLGSVADGAPIDTSSLGQHTFSVTAKDNATNQNMVTNTYFVDDEPAPAPPPPASPPAPPPPTPPTQPRTAASAARCVVPALRGRTVSRARLLLRRNQCALGTVTRRYSTRVANGRIVAQRPRSGLRLRTRSRVSVVVSRGRR